MKKQRKYGKYFWIDPKTNLGYAKVQVPTGERDAKDRIKYKTILKRADTMTAADQVARELFHEFNTRGGAFLAGRKMDFCDLAEWYKKEFVIEPIYSGNQKIAGMRQWRAERKKIDRLIRIFGKLLLNEIDELALRRYKLTRIKTGISPATVNRDFETIRAMLKKSVKMKWLKELPDFSGLIEKSLEVRRCVTISDAEETLILDAAKKATSAPRLYALVLTLRDTGARPSELYPVNDNESDYSKNDKTFFEPLRWSDVFDERGRIRDITHLTSFKGRIVEKRLCAITERMKMAFLDLWKYLSEPKRAKRLLPEHRAELQNLIFPQTSFKRSWQTIRDETGLQHLRLRDLRRDWSTRLARLGLSDRLAQRALGHKQMQMSYEYTVFDVQAAMIAKRMLDGEIIEMRSENN